MILSQGGRFGSWLLMGVTVLACCSLATAAERGNAETGKKPNILVIMADEHNAGVIGCYGNRVVQTPNLDRLATSGVRFSAAYTNSPLCVPCRLSFTSGKYISRVGAWSNDSWLPSDKYPSIARVMTEAGYDSILCGKMHYDRTRRYGFTEIGGNMNNSTKTGKGKRRDPDDLSGKRSDGGGRFEQFHAGEKSGILDHDRLVTSETVAFLKNRKLADKPFFMFVGYLAPHFPLIVPEEYWKRYRGKVPMPEIPPGHLDTLPLNYRHLRVGFGMVDPDPEIVRKGRELYYGLTDWFDGQVGQVLDTLKATGLADNTVVIYTADHGENMGEHGLWWKNNMFEHSARVPLIVSWPARWKGGQTRTGACSLVDVVQTIAEVGGTQTPSDWNGTSMCQWLDDADASWKDSAISEYYAHHIASGFVMYRQGRFKYVYHTRPDARHSSERELYDLSADPGEYHNLAADPQHKDLIATLHASIVKELGEDPEITEQRCRAEIAKGYDRPENTRRAGQRKARRGNAK